MIRGVKFFLNRCSIASGVTKPLVKAMAAELMDFLSHFLCSALSRSPMLQQPSVEQKGNQPTWIHVDLQAMPVAGINICSVRSSSVSVVLVLILQLCMRITLVETAFTTWHCPQKHNLKQMCFSVNFSKDEVNDQNKDEYRLCRHYFAQLWTAACFNNHKHVMKEKLLIWR